MEADQRTFSPVPADDLNLATAEHVRSAVALEVGGGEIRQA